MADSALDCNRVDVSAGDAFGLELKMGNGCDVAEHVFKRRDGIQCDVVSRPLFNCKIHLDCQCHDTVRIPELLDSL
jgi:hypothetical protein